jgi:hypothetical protein
MTPLQLQLSTMQALRRFYSRSAIATSAVKGVLRHIPQLLEIAARHARGLTAALAAEARSPNRRGRGTEGDDSIIKRALADVAAALSADELRCVEAALQVAALRLYGRRRVAEFAQQAHSQRHIARLQAAAAG